MFNCCMSNLLFQGFGKIYQVLLHDDYFWMLNTVQKLYDAHIKTKCPVRSKYFQQFGLITEYMFIFWLVAYSMSIPLVFSLVIYVYAVDDKLIPLLPFYLPFIDENTFIGYISLFMLHITSIFTALMGFVTIEFLLTVMVVSSLIFSILISLDIRKTDDELQLTDSTAKFRLWNIILMHQELSEYEMFISKNRKKYFFSKNYL